MRIETLRAGWDGKAAAASSRGLAPKLQALNNSQLSADARQISSAWPRVSDGSSPRMSWAVRARNRDSETFQSGRSMSSGDQVSFANAALTPTISVTTTSGTSRTPISAPPGGATITCAWPRLCCGVGADTTVERSAECALRARKRGDDAVAWVCTNASEASQAVHATSEALRLLERALNLIARLPETVTRTQSTVEILSAIPVLIASVEGFSSRRLLDAQQRAINRGRAVGVEPTAALLRSLAMTSLSRGDFDSPRRIGAELTSQGERDADATMDG